MIPHSVAPGKRCCDILGWRDVTTRCPRGRGTMHTRRLSHWGTFLDMARCTRGCPVDHQRTLEERCPGGRGRRLSRFWGTLRDMARCTRGIAPPQEFRCFTIVNLDSVKIDSSTGQSNLPEPMGHRVQTTIIQPWAHSYLGDCYLFL